MKKIGQNSKWICWIFIASAYWNNCAGLATFKGHTYHGEISEDAKPGDEVQLDMPLSVRNRNKLSGDEICGYTIYKWRGDQPFRVDLVDGKTGQAKLVVDKGYQLDYEHRHKYSFEIAAYDCVNGLHADREKVRVKINDVNDHAPVWTQTVYGGLRIEEGLLNQEVVRVEATDSDGSDLYSRVCVYRIVTPGLPFMVDENGYVRNTKPLLGDEQSHYDIEIEAEDCGGKVSEHRAVVSVDVHVICQPRWTEYENRVDIVGPPGVKQALMPRATLNLCNATCRPVRVTADIRLDTTNIARGCDRDDYSISAHRRMCGGSPLSVDLLPRPTAPDSWTRGLPLVSGQGLDPVFSFDGVSTAVVVPEAAISPLPGNRFTLTTWLKHERNERDSNPHGSKEHIVCAADGDGMNRHHFALYIHNCRLILLLRREPTTELPITSLKPAEWRWTLSEVCDGKWHHYAISVDLPEVRLYVDGKPFSGVSGNNPEILEDWPLHEVNSVHYNKLTVGSCWQGGKNRMGYYLRGELTGLTLLKNQTESEQVFKCLNNCQEKLELSQLEDMDTGMSVSMNSEMSSVTVVGLTVDSVENLLHNIAYINHRLSPTPGLRGVHLTTQVLCSGQDEPLKIEDVDLDVLIYEAEQIQLSLSGTSELSVDDHDLSGAGVLVLRDVSITASTKSDTDGYLDLKDSEPVGRLDLSGGYLVDSCSVDVDPVMDSEVESFQLPMEQGKKFGLELASTEHGFIIAGADKMSTYETLLRAVRYFNSRGGELNSRLFVLTCTEVNQHLLSNRLQVKVSVIHKVPESPKPHAKVMSDRAAAPAAVIPPAVASRPLLTDTQRLISNSFPTNFKYQSQETAGVGVAVVMVVCVGFVLMLIVVGIIRIRSAQRAGEGEREWGEGGGLNITINPMDPDNAYVEEDEEENGVVCHGDESDSEEEDLVYRDDRMAHGPCEDQSKRLQGRHLRWDKTTLAL